MKLGLRHTRTEKASRSNENGRICLKERTCFLPPRWGLRVFVIQGAEDFTTPTSLARTYLNSLHAPRKAFATIEGGGHFAVFMKQDAFLKELRARVLPLIR